MANYAYLLATNTKEPTDSSSRLALRLRVGTFMIPLLWFGCFRTLDVNKHRIQCITDRGERGYFEALTLYAKRSTVISSFREFANRLVASRAITLPSIEHLRALYADLTCVDCYAFQLDCSDLQMVVSQEEFDVWFSKGLEFAEKVSCGAWSNLLVLDEQKTAKLADLFELAHIYWGTAAPEEEESPAVEFYPRRETGSLASALQSQAQAVKELALPEQGWECSNWQHSLIGMPTDA
ncbi:MAG: hypothetical protein ACRD3W_19130 [Terriglobales bacterium]